MVPPHYVPYTPRQRVQHATTSATALSQPNADATRRLQMTNLQSAVQEHDVDTSSVGWAILEWIIHNGNESIWNAIQDNKASILLPLEHVKDIKIDVDFVKDHIAFVDKKDFVTLSGLRGTLSENTLTLSSSIHPAHPFFHSLSSLPPLPATHTDHLQYTLPSHISSLPFPPRILTVPPPLPPRPIQSRVSNPFASLFGGTPKRTATPASRPTSPAPSIEDPPSPQIANTPAFTITKHISFAQVGIALESAISGRVKDVLEGEKEGLIVSVLAFCLHWAPLIQVDKKWMVNPLWNGKREMDEYGKDVQAFIEGLDADNETLSKVEAVICTLFYDRIFRSPGDLDRDKLFVDRAESVKDMYGLDELGIRVDALSPTDGSLLQDNHPGLQIVKEVAAACGQVLSRLNDPACRSPEEKSSTIVEAHKVLVDGLSNQPTLRISPKAEESVPTELNKTTPSDPLISPSSPNRLTSSPPPLPSSSPLSSDLLLPLFIYTLIQTRPAHLFSHLLFIQRFRCPLLATGEEAFCLVNMLAGAEYVVQVQGETGTPPPSPPAIPVSTQGKGVNIVGAAKMITDVVDSSFGILKSLTVPSLPKRDTGPGLGGIISMLPGSISREVSREDDAERPLVAVNGSVRDSDFTDASSSDEDEEEDEEGQREYEHDARSIRSFESMMSSSRRRKRKSLSDRLVGALKKPPPGTYPPPNPRFMECDEDDIKVSEVGELLQEYKRLVQAVKANGGYLGS